MVPSSILKNTEVENTIPDAFFIGKFVKSFINIFTLPLKTSVLRYLTHLHKEITQIIFNKKGQNN